MFLVVDTHAIYTLSDNNVHADRNRLPCSTAVVVNQSSQLPSNTSGFRHHLCGVRSFVLSITRLAYHSLLAARCNTHTNRYSGESSAHFQAVRVRLRVSPWFRFHERHKRYQSQEQPGTPYQVYTYTSRMPCTGSRPGSTPLSKGFVAFFPKNGGARRRRSTPNSTDVGYIPGMDPGTYVKNNTYHGTR